MQQLQEQQQQQQQGQEAKFEANEAEMSLTTQLPSRGSEYNIKTGPQYNSASSTRQRETGRQTVRFHSWHWTLFFFFCFFVPAVHSAPTGTYYRSHQSHLGSERNPYLIFYTYFHVFRCMDIGQCCVRTMVSCPSKGPTDG
jgi:hypothetical protein